MLLALFSDHPMTAVLTIALLPAVAVALMGVMKPEQAAIIVVFSAVFFAPEEAYVKLPSVPYIMKSNAAAIGVLIGAAILSPQHIIKGKPGSWPGSLIFVSSAGAILTALTNPDQLVAGSGGGGAVVVMPGLSLNDGFYMSLKDIFEAYLIYFVGFAFVRDRQSMRFLASVLMSLFAIYTVLILIELRFSPQTHAWIYGYGAHGDFQQTRRWGGWRPMVFMKHGLGCALLVFVCNMAMMGLYRAKEKPGFFGGAFGTAMKWKHILWSGFIVLFATKSSGAIIYGFLFLPLAAKAKAKTIINVAYLLAVLALFYPLGRAYQLVPIDPIVGTIHSISPERAESINFRFSNEKKLMVKVRKRLWFGWGEYGRQFFYNYNGQMETIPDGYWIIIVGSRGVFGHLPSFLMLLYPVFMAKRRLRYVKRESDKLLLACLTLALATAVTDLVPNGLFSNYPFFLSGALAALWYALGDPKAKHVDDDDDTDDDDGSGGGGGGKKAPVPPPMPPGYYPPPYAGPPQWAPPPGYPPGYGPPPAYPPQGYPPPPGGYPPQGGAPSGHGGQGPPGPGPWPQGPHGPHRGG